MGQHNKKEDIRAMETVENILPEPDKVKTKCRIMVRGIGGLAAVGRAKNISGKK